MNKFKPMLADPAPKNLQEIRYPVLVSPKYDGIRCTIQGHSALSRSLKLIPNAFVQRELAGIPEGLDGELMTRGAFNDVQDGIMSRGEEPDFSFNVFDSYEDAADSKVLPDFVGFQQRYDYLRQLVFRLKHPRVTLVRHELALNVEDLIAFEEEALAAGYEGIMIRDPHGPYKQGRATTKQGWLMKLKRFEDAEATIVGYVELMHNANEAKKNALGRTERSTAKAGLVPMGTLGAFVCTDPFDPSRTFEIGTMRIDAAGRKRLWDKRDSLVGSAFKFKYQPEAGGTHVHKPRSPVGLGLRDSRDLD